MFDLFYRFRSCPDSAKNGSDPITDPITGSALVKGLWGYYSTITTTSTTNTDKVDFGIFHDYHWPEQVIRLKKKKNLFLCLKAICRTHLFFGARLIQPETIIPEYQDSAVFKLLIFFFFFLVLFFHLFFFFFNELACHEKIWQTQ